MLYYPLLTMTGPLLMLVAVSAMIFPRTVTMIGVTLGMILFLRLTQP